MSKNSFFNKNLLKYALILLVLLVPSFAFAADSAPSGLMATLNWISSFVWDFNNSVINLVWMAVYAIVIKIVNVIVSWMLWLGFFVASAMDIFLIQVPDLSSLINSVAPQTGAEAGAFLQNAFFTASLFMLVISVGLWLFMGWFQFLKVAIANINQTARDDDERKMWFVKFTFKMIFALMSIALIPLLLKVLFYILFLISVLVFKMGIAPLNVEDWHDRDLLFKYPMTTIFMAATDIDGPNRKLILENYAKNQWVKQSFNDNIGIYVSIVNDKVYTVLKEASTLDITSLSSISWSAVGNQIASVAKAAFYIMLIFMFLTINMKIFTMLMTRYIGIIIHSVFIPLNVAMLWSPYVEKIWLRSIVSYIWSLLITPIIYGVAWFWITILLTFKTNVQVSLWAGANVDVYLYGSLMLVLGYWLYTFLYQVSQNFGSELENIVLGYSGRSWYDSSSDVQQGMGAAKSYLGLAAMQQSAQWLISQVGMQAGWAVWNAWMNAGKFAASKSASSLWAMAGWGIYGAGKIASALWAGDLGGKIEKFGSELASSQTKKLFGLNSTSTPTDSGSAGGWDTPQWGNTSS